MDDHVHPPHARTLTAATDAELDRLPLQDQYFDLDKLVYAKGQVTIPFFVDDALPHARLSPKT